MQMYSPRLRHRVLHSLGMIASLTKQVWQGHLSAVASDSVCNLNSSPRRNNSKTSLKSNRPQLKELRKTRRSDRKSSTRFWWMKLVDNMIREIFKSHSLILLLKKMIIIMSITKIIQGQTTTSEQIETLMIRVSLWTREYSNLQILTTIL